MTFYVVLVKVVPAAVEIPPGVACLLITLTSEQQGISLYEQFPGLHITCCLNCCQCRSYFISTVMLLKKPKKKQQKSQ